jgi:hypothetical protein
MARVLYRNLPAYISDLAGGLSLVLRRDVFCHAVTILISLKPFEH